ncbi:hypothetical protein BX666DRAFT_1945612 [Dichotomocladium elegans]|nr:hypothetical protein BX666DRAFT_1945612 [Dichotomocladium elegans]
MFEHMSHPPLMLDAVCPSLTLFFFFVWKKASELKTRRIFTSVVQIAERPLLEGLVIPLLPKLTKPDVQNLARIPFSPQNRISLLRTICADESLRPWQDPLLLLIEKTLSAQPLLLQPAQTFDLTTIVHQANMQILLVLTSKYGQSLVSQHLLDTVDATAQASQHVLKRAVMNHIASIRKRTIQNTK